jgi:gas vesicle protein
MDLGPYEASAADHQRTMAFLVGALLAMVGLLTGLLVEPRRGGQATTAQ